MKNKTLNIGFLSVLLCPIVWAGDRDIPYFPNITGGYENGEYWITLGSPTIIDGGDWAATRIIGKRKTSGYAAFYKNDPPDKALFLGGANHQSTTSINTYSKLLMKHYYTDSPLWWKAKYTTAYPPSDYCVTAAFYNGSTAIPGKDWTWERPPGVCARVPEIPAQCNITNNEIILDHKLINQKDVDGSIAENNFIINCSRSGTVRFSLTGGKTTLDIGGGMSTIKINDLPLLSNLKLNVGDNNLTIKSVLSGVKPGTWQASTVLLYEPV